MAEKEPEWWSDIPKRVKVGWMNYSVVLCLSRDMDKRGSIGEHDGNKSELRVDPELRRPYVGEVLYHEVLHAIWEVWHFVDEKIESVGEEMMVSVFSNAFCTVMVDNPGLYAWIEAALRSGFEKGEA